MVAHGKLLVAHGKLPVACGNLLVAHGKLPVVRDKLSEKKNCSFHIDFGQFMTISVRFWYFTKVYGKNLGLGKIPEAAVSYQ